MLPAAIRFEFQILSIGLGLVLAVGWITQQLSLCLLVFPDYVPGLAYTTGMDICVLG